MILGIIVFILIIVLSIIYKDDCYGWDETSIILAMIWGGIVCLLSSFIYSAIQPTQIVETKENIYTLETNIGTEGSFSLGYGSIDGEAYYYYYTKDEDGYYHIEKVKADKCKLKLTDVETPAIIKSVQKPEQNVNWLFCTGKPWNVCGCSEYELIVPTNTIQINSFNGMIN